MLRIAPLNRYPSKQKGLQRNARGLFCGNSWNRTNDTSIFSAVLYQLSYVAVSPLLKRALGTAKVRN